MYAVLDTYKIKDLGLWVNHPETISVLDFDPRDPDCVSQQTLEIKHYSPQHKRVTLAPEDAVVHQALYNTRMPFVPETVYQIIAPWCGQHSWIPLAWATVNRPQTFGALLLDDKRSDMTLPRWVLNRPDDFIWPADWESDFAAERYPSAGSLWLPDAAVAALKQQLSPELLATIAFCPLTFAERGQPAQLKPGIEQTPERSRFWYKQV